MDILTSLRLQRNLLLLLSSGLLIGIVSLSLYLNKIETRTILVPTIDKELVVGTHSVSPEYLKVRADQIIHLLFYVRKDTHDYFVAQLLKQCDSSQVLKFKEQLDHLTKDVTDKGYYYTFQASSYDIDSNNLTVKFQGYLDVYLNDKKIQSTLKSYSLGFINRGGIVNLISFEEVYV